MKIAQQLTHRGNTGAELLSASPARPAAIAWIDVIAYVMLNKMKPTSFSMRTMFGSVSGRNAAAAHIAGQNINAHAVSAPPMTSMIVNTGLAPSIRHITTAS